MCLSRPIWSCSLGESSRPACLHNSAVWTGDVAAKSVVFARVMGHSRPKSADLFKGLRPFRRSTTGAWFFDPTPSVPLFRPQSWLGPGSASRNTLGCPQPHSILAVPGESGLPFFYSRAIVPPGRKSAFLAGFWPAWGVPSPLFWGGSGRPTFAAPNAHDS